MSDIITMQVIQNSLVSTANEMGIAMMRSAYSTIFNEIHDFSCGILADDGSLVAEGLHLIQHMGGLEHSTKGMLDYFRREGLEINEGDVIFHNHPYISGTHVPEINVYAPLFIDGELVFIPAIRAHHQDVGGTMLGSTYMHATDVFQEGLLIPPIKVVDRGVLRKDILNMIVAASRTPKHFRGDLNAQIAGCRVGQQRLLHLVQKYGLRTVRDSIAMMFDYGERLLRSAISTLPEGSYKADAYADDDGVDGKPVRIAVTVTKTPENDIIVDFTGSAPQTKGPINIPWSGLCSAVYAGVFFMTLPDVKSNTGCYRPIRIIAPPGTVVNPRPPAPVIIMNDTFQRIHDAIIRALVPARPEKAYAGSMASTMTVFAGGAHPETGEYYIAPLYYSRLSGWGAHSCKDGKNVTTPPVGGSALRNTPMEVLERRFPLRVVQYSMRPNSGGPGEFRGGVGGTFEVIPLGHEITVTQQFQSVRCPPRGVDGGMAGRPSASSINSGQLEERRLPPMLSGFKVKGGQSYRLMYSGGGGWGDPFKRQPQRVLNDVIQGLVGVQEARTDYGVLIDPECLIVNEAATTAYRADPSNRCEPAPWPLLEV